MRLIQLNGLQLSCAMASVSAIGAVFWWNRCRSSDDTVAGIVLSFRARSDQVQSLKHLRPNAAEAGPGPQRIRLGAVGPPVVFIVAPMDLTHHPFIDNTIAGCLQNDMPAIQLKRVSHFWVV